MIHPNCMQAFRLETDARELIDFTPFLLTISATCAMPELQQYRFSPLVS